MNTGLCRCHFIFTVGIYTYGLYVAGELLTTIVPGENVTIQCSHTNSTSIYWYRHHGGQLPLLILQVLESHITAYNRLEGRYSCNRPSKALTIHNVTEADTATYYCAWRDKGVTVFVDGTTLRMNSTTRPDAKNYTDQGTIGPDANNCTDQGRTSAIIWITICLAVLLSLSLCCNVVVLFKWKGSCRSQGPNKKSGSEQAGNEEAIYYCADSDFSENQKRKKTENINTTYAVIQFQ
ncbi:uncharacterized protein LOC117406229 isoform X2 [Acipenser ruthenus]|uniref:uncharacterized protein LOC117406229 isoform X2 n=1 Tax=Acipenser ruthenus TaxID=7906 RepID=UPI00145B69E4|nr:uncharacterized protein LOC117406229 isoform X2 [Acipenser ruthenus]